MSLLFCDSSALVKNYITEVGSVWLQNEVKQNTVIISNVTVVEITSAFSRRLRDGSLSQADFQRVETNFLLHVGQDFIVVEISQQVINEASRLLKIHPLRTLDAIQLASANVVAKNVLTPPTFLSADQRLLQSAQSENLSTHNPNNYP